MAITECPVDIIFLLDTSSRIRSSDISRARNFIKDVAGRLEIDGSDDSKAQVGLVSFNNDASLIIELDPSQDNKDFEELVEDKVERGQSGESGRNLSAAIRLSHAAFWESEGWYRSTRLKYCKNFQSFKKQL